MRNILLSISLLFAFAAPMSASAKKIDSMNLSPACTPRYVATTEVKAVKTLAVVAYKGSRYYYVGVDGKRKNERLKAVVRVNKNCYLSFVDPGEASSLSEGVPVPVAKTLAVVAYRNAIQKRGGLKLYQTWFFRQGFTSLAPEDAFALQRLGIQVPKTIKIRPWSRISEKEQAIENGR
jgi:hypothetical protein